MKMCVFTFPCLNGQTETEQTHIADLLAAFMGLVLRGLQDGGELVLGFLILLPVLPLRVEVG